MEEAKLLQKIASDLSLVKQKVIKIEHEVEEINEDIHEIRPEYAEKLKLTAAGSFPGPSLRNILRAENGLF